VSCVRIVGLIVGFGIVVVVQENPTTGDSVDCPMVNAAAVVCGVSYKVGAFGLYELVWRSGIDAFTTYAIVEALAVNVAELMRC
jgi:hypothetical protein